MNAFYKFFMQFIEVGKTSDLKKFGISAAAICIGLYVLKRRKKQYFKYKANELLTYEKAAVEKQLQVLQEKLVKDAENIIDMDVSALISATQQGKLQPDKILSAYMYKACCVTKNLNCIAGLISNAYEVASALTLQNPENYLLFGLPVSLKESMRTKGMDSTIGLSCYIGQPALDDCVIVKVLKHCGAIPFVKTNLPQTMLSFESSNPIFGETSNPHDLRFTPGGSSSGEGSLIAAGGSPLGFGTDIAGSIRVPAHMCGIAGFKPTMNRLSKQGLQASLPGQTLVSSTLGPMARDVHTLVLAMQALLCPLMFELDPTVPPLPFNTVIYNNSSKLHIGFYDDDNYNKPIPAVKRAVSIAKNALERAGLFADGGNVNKTRLKNDQVDKTLHHVYQKWSYSCFVRWFKSAIVNFKWPRICRDIKLHGGEDCSASRLWRLESEALKYKQEFLHQWTAAGLDAIICPPFPVVAGPKGTMDNMSTFMSYTVLYNLLNYPGGVVPVTKVSHTDIESLEDHQGHYGDPWDIVIKTMNKDSLGMPVGVQCVALPWQDEICLRVMKEVESLVNF